MATVFFQRPRAVSRSETRVDQWQVFLIFNNIQAFSKLGRKKTCRVLHDPVERTSRHVCRNFRAKNRRSDLPVFVMKQNLAKKLDPTLTPCHLKEITHLDHFYAQKSVSTPFSRDIPRNFAHVFFMPIPKSEPGYLFLFLPPKIVGLRWFTVSEKK